MMTLGDLQAQAQEQEQEQVAEVSAEEIPAQPVIPVELTKLGTERARTRYNGDGFDARVRVLAYLPGSLPEQVQGETLALVVGSADEASTKDGRTKVQWTSSTPEGEALFIGYVPEDAKHVTQIGVQFPKGN